jgi:hypothetical protein
MSKITLSIIIDKKYVEPALVTLVTLLRFQKFYKTLKLILIKKKLDNQQDINEIIELIGKFKISFDHMNFIELVIIEDNFPEFAKFHFSNAILYKIFLPIILKDEDFILNVDAGNLFQNKFIEFSNYLNKLICHSNEFIIGAFLQSSKMQMPVEITEYSNFYPSGGLILFNSKNYFFNKTPDRIIQFYADKAIYLKYAEQEILCAIINDLEFYSFKGIEDVYLDDLSNYIGDKYSPIDQNKLNNSIYYKNQGSIKPWKKWNLNPNKAIYLKFRNDISKLIDLNQYAFIKDEQESISDNLVPFKDANLLSYEKDLIRRQC